MSTCVGWITGTLFIYLLISIFYLSVFLLVVYFKTWLDQIHVEMCLFYWRISHSPPLLSSLSQPSLHQCCCACAVSLSLFSQLSLACCLVSLSSMDSFRFIFFSNLDPSLSLHSLPVSLTLMCIKLSFIPVSAWVITILCSNNRNMSQ